MNRHPPAPPSRSGDDGWHRLQALTPARVALGRTGSALPTNEILRFGLAHAQARDAVHCSLESTALAARIQDHGFAALAVTSAAPDRAVYLSRPDLGRRLAPDARAVLAAHPGPVDLAVVVADGLSAAAVEAHAVAVLAALRPGVLARCWSVAPVVVATQARVALGDEIGALLGARLVLVLIGERPGLSSPDSLGAYLTSAPRPGRRDNERNCVSNIRPAGLAPERAAGRLLWLLEEAFRRGLTGVALKDESGYADLPAPPAPEADRRRIGDGRRPDPRRTAPADP